MRCAVCIYERAVMEVTSEVVTVRESVTTVDGNTVCAQHTRAMTQGWGQIHGALMRRRARLGFGD